MDRVGRHRLSSNSIGQESRRHFVPASTQLTHTDPKTVVGAEAIARLAAWAVEHDRTEPPNVRMVAAMLADLAPQDGDWRPWIEQLMAAYPAGE